MTAARQFGVARYRWLLAAALAVQPAVFALAATPVIVSQLHRAFSVREVHIKRGGVVRFNNDDEFIHHLYVNAANFKYSSAEQPPGQSVDIVFPTEGRFDVRCEIHPKMIVSVVVE